MPRSSPCHPSGRAEPAPPRGGGSQARWPGGERPGDRRFSRRDALCASAWYGRTNALAFHNPTRCVVERPVGLPGMSRSSASPPCGRAEPAPPRGGLSKLGWPSGGKPWHNAKGGFLGGTHSVRPRGKAYLMAVISSTGNGGRGTGFPMGLCPGESHAFTHGRAKPDPPQRVSSRGIPFPQAGN
jgi:hypothetical protein